MADMKPMFDAISLDSCFPIRCHKTLSFLRDLLVVGLANCDIYRVVSYFVILAHPLLIECGVV